MKSFAHFSILAIILMSILAASLFSKVESKPAPCIYADVDDGSRPYPCDPYPTKIITTKTKTTTKPTTTTTTKPTTTKKIKLTHPNNPHVTGFEQF